MPARLGCNGGKIWRITIHSFDKVPHGLLAATCANLAPTVGCAT
jgi:hypothetical protein